MEFHLNYGSVFWLLFDVWLYFRTSLLLAISTVGKTNAVSGLLEEVQL